MAQCQRPRTQNNDKTFFWVFTYIWQEDVLKFSKVAGAPPGRALG